MVDKTSVVVTNDALWYKDAIIYQLHVKSFFDSTGDGIGDFKGLSQKLDYLETLGATAIWLLPFYPSPLKDDGYDIADYYGIHPSYGTMHDFKLFLKEAHNRGMHVITELVLNHTSDQHSWFQRSRKAKPTSNWRDFYVWSDTTSRYRDARIIFKDFETSNWTWDHMANAYFWHRFYSHQPDLNFENPQVHEALCKVIDYWMDIGVDGMRLDAVPYLYEKEGTNCENLPETYAFLQKLRAHIDSRYTNRMLLAEANQWPEDAAAYFGTGDMCQMAFHFPLMPRMFMSLHMESYFPIIDILEQTPQIPQTCQWGIFLRNHDELTLEMVTDEERIYMYRYYGSDPSSRINLGIRRRLLPLLNNSRHRMELMNILLFSLPGTPIIYYGDEIGMGDNHYLGDRNGVRTPMQWSPDRNAGFSLVNPQKLYLPLIIDPEYNYETVNVETQNRNLSSILWWMRRVIAMRTRYKSFARGDIEFIKHGNASVLVFLRKYQNEKILVVINLSRFSQVVYLNLSQYAGYIPRDIFSNNRFPLITVAPYVLTMGFHDYFWFYLENKDAQELEKGEYQPQTLTFTKKWWNLFDTPSKTMIEQTVMPGYLQNKIDSGVRDQRIRDTRIKEMMIVDEEDLEAVILFVSVLYDNSTTDLLMLTFSYLKLNAASSLIGNNKNLLFVYLKDTSESQDGIIYDCMQVPSFHKFLLKLATSRKKLVGQMGAMQGSSIQTIKTDMRNNITIEPIITMKSRGHNTSFSYATGLYHKIFKRLEEGVNPEVEMLEFLSEKQQQNVLVPSYCGTIDYQTTEGKLFTIGMLSSYIQNTGSVWKVAIDAAVKFLEQLLSNHHDISPIQQKIDKPFEIPHIPESIKSAMGMYPEISCAIGRHTAEMHQNLCSDQDSKEFAPEPFTMLYQQSVFQGMQSYTKQVFTFLRTNAQLIPSELKDLVQMLLTKEQKIITSYKKILKKRMNCMKIRIHGDLHLGQFRIAGTHFFVKDFEGNPFVVLSERRLKRSPLRDVVTVVYSIHLAVCKALYYNLKVQQKDVTTLEPWAHLWFKYMSALYIDSYCKTIETSNLIPYDESERSTLMQLFLIEHAIRELHRHLTTRSLDSGLSIRAMQPFIHLVS